jgi:hypothetical protein
MNTETTTDDEQLDRSRCHYHATAVINLRSPEGSPELPNGGLGVDIVTVGNLAG